MDYLAIGLGERFDHGIPDEGMSIVIAAGTPLLVFNFSATPRDIKAFSEGAASFALFAKDTILFFLFKIDGFLDWSDLAFTIHLEPEETIEGDSAYLPINLVLVDSSTKIVKGLRVITVSPHFRAYLADLIARQASEPFDTLGYYQAIGQLYQQYPSAQAMLKEAVIIEQGGTTLPKDYRL